MVFVSATRLRLKSMRYLFAFLKAGGASGNQLALTKGFLGGCELMDKKLTFWTITMWAEDAHMKDFRNSAPHKKAMQKLPDWCNEASYVHWLQDENKLPDWTTVHSKMITEGKNTKVRHPSSNQDSMAYPTIKWTKLGRKFKPAEE